MKKEKTVMNTVIEEIRKGMKLRKPVIYLQTTDLEIVRRVLNSDRIVVRMTKRPEDTRRIFSGTYKDNFYGDLVDDRIRNISCCSEGEINNYIEAMAKDNDDEQYGKFKNKISHSVPSLLAVHVRKTAEFNGLFPFIDRYEQEADDYGPIRSSLVLLHGEQMELPAWLTPYCYIVEVPYPERGEIMDIIQQKTKAFGLKPLSDEKLASYADDFLGNSLIQVEGTVEYLLNQPCNELTGQPFIEDVDKVQKELTDLKKQNVRKSGLLELVKIENNGLGGMKVFQDWLERNKESIKNSEKICRETGADRQKGILMCGIPGCGKSAAVNLLGEELKLAVLRMDVGTLMGKYVGESEQNMHKALSLAEAMAPCILFVDEIEKGFSGAQGGESSDVTRRMFGTLLSWMQDCKKPVYFFATANGLNGIPKEFFRSGRFDSLFALYMPTYEECIDIFITRMNIAEEHIQKYEPSATLFSEHCRDRDKLGLVIDSLCSEAEGQEKGRFLTGADITKIVNIALREYEGRTPILHTEWIEKLKEVEAQTSVYGDGEENLSSIAACYLKMIRLGFQPTSEGSLFRKEDYMVVSDDEGKVKPYILSYEERNRNNSDIKEDYDRILYNTIREKMLIFAEKMEESAIRELLK